MNILYVEDDAMNRRVVRDMLCVMGVSMHEAHDGETGLRMVGEGDYHLVLMDLRMPGLDGLTAIERLRGRGDNKARLPVIVVTADTAADLKERCTSAGADDVLQKPIAMASLIEAVGRVIAAQGSAGLMLT